ncbi:MAG: extracellular solute-binding protein [Fimbriimonadaceae bacterium]
MREEFVRSVSRGVLRGALVLAACCSAAAATAVVHLRMICWDGEDNIVPVRDAVQAFERAHPDIHVTLEAVVANYQEKLLAEVAAGTAPDVVHMDPPSFQKFAQRGALLPLNQFFRETPGFDLKAYYKNLVDASTMNGLLYILPRDIAPIVPIFYNKKIFDEEHIPYPDGKWTWDFVERPELREHDFLWMMHHLTKKDAAGKVIRWGFAPAWKTAMVETCYLELGARVADNYEHPTRVLLDDPRIVKAFQFVADLSLKEQWIPSDVEINSELQTNTRKLFTEGRIAMMQSGIWESTALRNEIVKGQPGYFDWDIAMAPAYKNGVRAYPTGGSGYSIMSQTKHPHEAWLLTEWMAGAPGMLPSAEQGMAQPAIRRLSQTPPWIPTASTPNALARPRNRIIMDQGANYVVFGPTSMDWPEVYGFVDDQIQSIFDGTATAQVALRRGTKRAQRRLDMLRRDERLGPYNWRLGAVAGGAILLAVVGWIYGPELRVRRSKREKQEGRIAYLFVLPCLLGIVLFTLGPMLLSLLMSFAKWDIIRPAQWRGLGNYSEALTSDPTFWVALRVTLVYTVAAVPIGLVTGLALALLLNTKIRGMPVWRTCYYLPSIVSGVAAAIVWKSVFRADGGVLNSIIYGAHGDGNFLGLASLLRPLATINGEVNWLGDPRTALSSLVLMSLWGVGGGMVIMLAGLQGVPEYYYEAAILDGAGAWRRFLNVTLPLISPTLFFSLITGFIGSFQVFTQAFVMTNGGPDNATQFYMLHLFNEAFMSLHMGYASALAWVLFFVILCFTLAQIKFSKWVYYEGAR